MSKFWSGVAATLGIIMNLLASIGEIKTTSVISNMQGRFFIWTLSLIFIAAAIVFWNDRND